MGKVFSWIFSALIFVITWYYSSFGYALFITIGSIVLTSFSRKMKAKTDEYVTASFRRNVFFICLAIFIAAFVAMYFAFRVV